MNSYYSNLIEGHRTLPRDIERAQRHDYSADPAKRENQHLTQAHIEVEQAMVERLRSEPELSIHSCDFLCWLHAEFYVGAGGTVAREVIRLALAEKLLDSASPKGPLSLVFSAQTLDSYFPQLFQDLPVAVAH